MIVALDHDGTSDRDPALWNDEPRWVLHDSSGGHIGEEW